MTDLRAVCKQIFNLFQMPMPSDPLSEEMNRLPSTALMVSLESILREVVEDAFAERGSLFQQSVSNFPNELKQARADALEEAAKICDANTKPSKELCNSDYHDVRWCSDCDRMTAMADILGQEIRALKP